MIPNSRRPTLDDFLSGKEKVSFKWRLGHVENNETIFEIGGTFTPQIANGFTMRVEVDIAKKMEAVRLSVANDDAIYDPKRIKKCLAATGSSEEDELDAEFLDRQIHRLEWIYGTLERQIRFARYEVNETNEAFKSMQKLKENSPKWARIWYTIKSGYYAPESMVKDAEKAAQHDLNVYIVMKAAADYGLKMIDEMRKDLESTLSGDDKGKLVDYRAGTLSVSTALNSLIRETERIRDNFQRQAKLFYSPKKDSSTSQE